jgi:cell wall-associated NlpC family hydrolase
MTESEQEQRAAVIAEARSWILTPVHHGARLKGVGVDCGQFIIGVFEACGLVPPIPIESYPRDWFVHRDDDLYLDLMRAHATEIAGPPEAADVIMFWIGRNYAHGGIVTRPAPLTIVHASPPTRMVMEETLHPRGELLREKSGRKPPIYFTKWQ